MGKLGKPRRPLRLTLILLSLAAGTGQIEPVSAQTGDSIPYYEAGTFYIPRIDLEGHGALQVSLDLVDADNFIFEVSQAITAESGLTPSASYDPQTQVLDVPLAHANYQFYSLQFQLTPGDQLRLAVADGLTLTGEADYKQQCADCHGNDGQGGSAGVSLANCFNCSDSDALSSYIAGAISQEHDGSCMQTCADAVADYIFTIFQAGDSPLAVSITDSTISENGGSTTGTVTRGGSTAGDLQVTLSSDDSGEASVPATVTIPSGQASIEFLITGVDDSLLDGTQTVTITATATGYTSGSDQLSVSSDDVGDAITISSAGFDADSDGSIYTLTQDIVADSGTALRISGDNVVIDGGGHTITFSETGAGTGIYIDNAANVEIRNLTLQQGAYDFGSGGRGTAIDGSAGGRMNFHDLTLNLIARADASDMHGISLGGVESGSGSEIYNSTFNITGENAMKAMDGGAWLFHDNVMNVTNLKRSGSYARLLNVGSDSEYYDNTITVDAGSQYVNVFVSWSKDNVKVHDNIIEYASRHGRIIHIDNGSDGWKVYNNSITVTSQNSGDEVTYAIRIRSDGSAPTTNHEVYNNTVIADNSNKSTTISLGGSDVATSGIRVHHNRFSGKFRTVNLYGGRNEDIDFYRNEIAYTGSGYDYPVYINGGDPSDITFSHNVISGGNPDDYLIRATKDMEGTGAVTICGSDNVTESTLNVASEADFVLRSEPCQDGDGDTAPIGYQAPP